MVDKVFSEKLAKRVSPVEALRTGATARSIAVPIKERFSR